MYKGFIRAIPLGWEWGVVYADEDGKHNQTIWGAECGDKGEAKSFALAAAKRLNTYGDEIHVLEPEI